MLDTQKSQAEELHGGSEEQARRSKVRAGDWSPRRLKTVMMERLVWAASSRIFTQDGGGTWGREKTKYT